MFHLVINLQCIELYIDQQKKENLRRLNSHKVRPFVHPRRSVLVNCIIVLRELSIGMTQVDQQIRILELKQEKDNTRKLKKKIARELSWPGFYTQSVHITEQDDEEAFLLRSR